MAYLHLELSRGRHEAACRVLLRAVQQCATVKQLWCVGLSLPLVGLLPAPQLADSVQIMSQKEIRLRHETPEELHPLEPRPTSGGAAWPTDAVAAAAAVGQRERRTAARGHELLDDLTGAGEREAARQEERKEEEKEEVVEEEEMENEEDSSSESGGSSASSVSSSSSPPHEQDGS